MLIEELNTSLSTIVGILGDNAGAIGPKIALVAGVGLILRIMYLAIMMIWGVFKGTAK